MQQRHTQQAHQMQQRQGGGGESLAAEAAGVADWFDTFLAGESATRSVIGAAAKVAGLESKRSPAPSVVPESDENERRARTKHIRPSNRARSRIPRMPSEFEAESCSQSYDYAGRRPETT